MLAIISVLLFFAIYYYYQAFIRIDGLVIVDSNQITLESPGKGVVESMIKIREFEDIKEGEKIAVIGLHVSDVLTLDQEISSIQEKLLSIDEEIERLKTSNIRESIKFLQKLRDVDKEIEAARLETVTLKAKKITQDELYKISDSELTGAAKLYKLEIININQYKKFQKEALTSKSDLSEVNNRIDYYENIIKHLKHRTELLGNDKEQYLAEYNKDVESQIKKRTFLESKLKEYTSYANGKSRALEIYSPINGRVLQNHITTGDSLTEGSQLITLYRPEVMELRVYVEERYMDRLKPSSRAIVKIFDKKFETKILRINKVITHSPRELRGRRLVPEDRYYFTVDLVTDNLPEGLFPGKTGRVIFKQ
ncbi:HlyD family efflux transporter periplasmic adaptor subunit [Lentisphaera profundi]|uniref:HlyD family efflux transporter periplasmic adaptor subunit n=1 Tax=Lentisphaera profundi TaxID=1658616 RepID=A0ABY7VUQ5_9BACT|nr:HlyD family efflux transporter periplasmic adaptor subunit [Lentisphaera profundi]WDE97013.1 HlyD family efflux transporter periplasmic adaptor subunit [Lentisphaera profundi]